jgi:GrxC family glutaredoxin
VKKITIYTTTYCGYCRLAKHLLEHQEVHYTEIDVTDDDAKRQWLVEVTGHRTVPQIFSDEQPIGGYTDLSELIKNNQFRPMINDGHYL